MAGGASLVAGFQFHKGAIETLKSLPTLSRMKVFQFHKGAIETWRPHPLHWFAVRFQFHKGAIETEIADYDWCTIDLSIP